jgi:spore coat polysaccharide biosynthesis protein SpsF
MSLCILQARMGSTRLPGKVLSDIAGKSMLQHILERLAPAKSVSRFVIATTTLPEDDAIVDACHQMGALVFRGSDWDVLDRFYNATQLFGQREHTIVRICCDNPTHHYSAIDFVNEQFLRYGVDYFSNGNEGPSYYEDGFTAEVFTRSSLEQAWQESTLLSEREHVTPYIKKSGKFSCGWRKMIPDYAYKLSVDTPTDLLKAKNVFQALGDSFTPQELVAFLKGNPHFAIIDPASTFNAGYMKSLNEDKKVR